MGSLQSWAGTWPRCGGVRGDPLPWADGTGHWRLMQRLKELVMGHMGLRPAVRGTALQPCRAGECGAQGNCGGAEENKRGPCGAAVSSLLNAASSGELTEQIMSGDVGAGPGSTGNCAEPAFPITPANSTNVRICRVMVGTLHHPRAFGRPLGEGLITALCLLCPHSAEMLQDQSPSCTEQDSSHSGFVPSGAAEEGE